MPEDVSSSEDEAENIPTNSVASGTGSEKISKFKCPADFVSFHHEPCSSTLTDHLKKHKKELWLIKAPSNFNPACFSGLQVALSGLQTVTLPGTNEQQIYNVLASDCAPSDLRLLTSSKRASSGGVCAPTFSGLLNICESHLDPKASLEPQVIPSVPPPTIPTGLRQRFQPFGCTMPLFDHTASITLQPLLKTQPVEEAREEEGHKKKKRKKEKQMEEVKVKKEIETLMEEEEQTEEKRKKKKKKKEREREEVVVVKKEEEVWIKTEPMVGFFVDTVGEKKKKKKKKKSRADDD